MTRKEVIIASVAVMVAALLMFFWCASTDLEVLGLINFALVLANAANIVRLL